MKNKTKAPSKPFAIEEHLNLDLPVARSNIATGRAPARCWLPTQRLLFVSSATTTTIQAAHLPSFDVSVLF